MFECYEVRQLRGAHSTDSAAFQVALLVAMGSGHWLFARRACEFVMIADMAWAIALSLTSPDASLQWRAFRDLQYFTSAQGKIHLRSTGFDVQLPCFEIALLDVIGIGNHPTFLLRSKISCPTNSMQEIRTARTIFSSLAAIHVSVGVNHAATSAPQADDSSHA